MNNTPSEVTGPLFVTEWERLEYERDTRMRREAKTIIARFLSNQVEPSVNAKRRAEQIITALERLGLKIGRRDLGEG